MSNNINKGKITTRQLSDEVLKMIDQKAVTYVQKDIRQVSYYQGGINRTGDLTNNSSFPPEDATKGDSWSTTAAFIYPSGRDLPDNSFNKETDLLLVYLNGVFLAEKLDYEIGSNSRYIYRVKSNMHWKMRSEDPYTIGGVEVGEPFPANGNQFTFVILKGARANYGTIDGSDIMEGTINENKFSEELLNKLNNKLSDENLDGIRNEISIINDKITTIDPSLAESNVLLGTLLDATEQHTMDYTLDQDNFINNLKECSIRRLVFKLELLFYNGEFKIDTGRYQDMTNFSSLLTSLVRIRNAGINTSIIIKMSDDVVNGNGLGGPTNDFFSKYSLFLSQLLSFSLKYNEKDISISDSIDHIFIFYDCDAVTNNEEKVYKVSELMTNLKDLFSTVKFGFITDIQNMDIINGNTMIDYFDIIGIMNNPELTGKESTNEAYMAMNHVGTYNIFNIIDKICKDHNKRYIVTEMGYKKSSYKLSNGEELYADSYLNAAFNTFKHSDYCDEFWIKDVTYKYASNYNWMVEDNLKQTIKLLGGK